MNKTEFDIQTIPSDVLIDLKGFIESQFGLSFPDTKNQELIRAIEELAKDKNLCSSESCIKWLLTARLSKKDLEDLAACLTVGETFFFRDQTVFDALKKYILEEIIPKKTEKKICLLSVGCSSGEEPYSIAILMDQIAYLLKGWDICILAADVNSDAINKAKRGIYTKWSFRGIPETIIQKYFKILGDNKYEISPDIKKKVTFLKINLIKPDFKSYLPDDADFDIIFCRNVLMYFEETKREESVKRLCDILNDVGWLIVSPVEEPFIANPELTSLIRYSVGIFKKGISKNILPIKAGKKGKIDSTYIKIKNTKSDKKPIHKSDNREFNHEDLYAEALILYNNGNFDEAVNKFSENIAGIGSDTIPVPYNTACMAILAKCLANTGNLADARIWIEKAIYQDKLNPVFYYLLASIHQEQGGIKESIKALKNALFLDPNFILANFALGALLNKEGYHIESKKYLENAGSLLQETDINTVIPLSGGITANYLTTVLKKMI